MEMFPVIEGSPAEFNAIIRGLYTVAHVDGLHEREVKVIADLFRARLAAAVAAGAGEETPEALQRQPVLEPHVLATLLPLPAHREQFLTAAYWLAWADGQVSFAERASIDAFASAFGVGADVLSRCEGEVKKRLLLKERRADAAKDASSP